MSNGKSFRLTPQTLTGSSRALHYGVLSGFIFWWKALPCLDLFTEVDSKPWAAWRYVQALKSPQSLRCPYTQQCPMTWQLSRLLSCHTSCTGSQPVLEHLPPRHENLLRVKQGNRQLCCTFAIEKLRANTNSLSMQWISIWKGSKDRGSKIGEMIKYNTEY